LSEAVDEDDDDDSQSDSEDDARLNDPDQQEIEEEL
jgi:hypothetical protein